MGYLRSSQKKKLAVYDRCYIFEDINYINKNIGEQKDFLMNLMFWLNSMDVEFKITLANEYQSMAMRPAPTPMTGEAWWDVSPPIR